MVRWIVGMDYFPFFLEPRDEARARVVFLAVFLAAVFLAAVFALGAAVLAAALAALAGALAVLALLARDGALCLASASSRSAIGVRVSPIAPDSINTASDHNRW